MEHDFMQEFDRLSPQEQREFLDKLAQLLDELPCARQMFRYTRAPLLGVRILDPDAAIHRN